MGATPPAQASPSEQLVSFNPTGLEAVGHRGSGDTFSGISTMRPSADPFAGWPNKLGSGPNVSASQVTNTSPGSGFAYQSYVPDQNFQALGSSAQISPLNAHAALEYPSAPRQLSSASAVPGGMQYSPSQVRTSGTHEQWQYSPYSPSHGPAHPSASQYPVSPIQTTGASARYSPSHGQLNYEYSPTPGFSRWAATAGRAPPVDVFSATSNAFARAIGQAQADHTAALPSLSHGDLVPNGNCRSFIVHDVPRDTPHCSIALMLPFHEYPSLEDVCLKQIEQTGMFSLSFADLREAVSAMNKIRLNRPEWKVTPVTSHEIATFLGAAKNPSVIRDGEFMVTACADLSEWNKIMGRLDMMIEGVIASFGPLRSVRKVEEGTCMRRYHVAYYNMHHATYAFSCLDGYKLEALRFNVSGWGQDDSTLYPRLRIPNYGSLRSPLTPRHRSSGSKEKGPEYNNEMKMDISPRSDECQTSPEHLIDLERIKLGSDVRSTVMIRHIPNRITSNQLKDILDESSYGKYDFLYLRMDFVHGCNVGYAFVNFGDPIDIVNLVRARQGNTWPDCMSEKKAEISYATLQGKEALVNKFRNSHVMTRPAEERPRLFHISGPRAGTEASFPSPNDASKLRRSVASTTQQGLFAPRNRALSTPRTNRMRTQSQSFSQTPRSRPPNRTPRHGSGRSLQYSPEELPLMRTDDRRFSQGRN